MSTSPSKATVIGSQGFIGRALTSELQIRGWDCWLPDRGTLWPQPSRELGHIFYCAGLTADFVSRPADTVEAHVGLLSRVLQSPNYQSLVYLSSTRIYDGLTTSSLADESASLYASPSQPRHLFDLTKLTGESLCHTMSQGRARIARLACVYSECTFDSGFLSDLLRKLKLTPSGSTLSVPSSPHFSRDYVHVHDVVQALIAIATHGIHPVYNVASGENLHNFELASEVARVCNRHIVFESDVLQPGLPKIDVRLIRTTLDWQAERVFEIIGPFLRALPA